MKRIVTLFICCLMLFGTVAFAEDTAYSKLNDLEKEIYDCFMIMVLLLMEQKELPKVAFTL